jgi:hypothetical protein
MLTVPVMREAVKDERDLPVDLAFVVQREGGVGRSLKSGRGGKKVSHNGQHSRSEGNFFVAVEAQGPQHFVSARCAREIRSSRLKRLLRQFVGWHVVNIDYKVWSKMQLAERQDWLREELAYLPSSVWRTPEV